MIRFPLVALAAGLSMAACATTSAPNAPEPAPAQAPVEPSATVAPGVLEVETSTDVDFVTELPIDDAPDRGVRLGDRPIDPILAVTGTVAEYDLPLASHERVDFWIDYLSDRGREHFTRWLSRSTRYVPLFWSILDRYGLPRDLVFLSMVESGFSTSAYSWAHAAGPWQFVSSTARRYGLRIDFWVDDRRDFERATDAAARHLEDLYEMYGDWFLAMAAYNAGPGKVNRAIRRYRTDDFWELSKRRYLRRETKHYVPKILAAAQLSKLPHVYGIGGVEYQPPLEWEVVTVTTATSLRAMAAACPLEVTEDEIRALNPALRCGVTPPGERWSIRVPKAVTATCAEAFRRAPAREAFVYRYHPVASSDRIEVVATRHQTTREAILEFNRIDPDQFLDFEEIVIPVPKEKAAAVPIEKPPQLAFRPPGYGPQSLRLVRYRVRSGDSLWRISQRFHVAISDLMKWNGLRRSSTLRIGDRLRIYLGGRAARAIAAREDRKPSRPADSGSDRVASRSRARAARSRPEVDGRHTVRSGESPWLIADRYGLEVGDVLAVNDLQPGDVIQPGQTIRLPAAPTKSEPRARAAASGRRGSEAGRAGGHVVRPGESFWSIATRHGTTVERLCAVNGLARSDEIQPGQVLRLPEGRTRPPSSSPEAEPRPGEHRVRTGESLWSIAMQHGLTVGKLCELNGLSPDAVIQPGDSLRVKP